jgi:YbbR domain-containing protein
MLSSLRQNLFLKIFSLIAAITLYIYVQGERNPTVTRILIATLQVANVAAGVEVVPEREQVEVTVTGPRQIVERVQDSDIRATLDLSDPKIMTLKNTLVRLNLRLQNLPPEMASQISLDSPTRVVKVDIYPQKKTQLRVYPRYPKDPPAGFRYGSPRVLPEFVTVTGREDRINRIERLIVNASPPETGASIEGEFLVLARDSNDKPVDNVTIQPPSVRVSVQLLEEPYSKIVTVSPNISDLPLPPYKLAGVRVEPNQVKLVGRPNQLNQVFTIATEEISVRDLSDSKETRDILVNLSHSPDIIVRDLNDRPISQVKVTVTIRRVSAPATPTPPTSVPNRTETPPNP